MLTTHDRMRPETRSVVLTLVVSLILAAICAGTASAASWSLQTTPNPSGAKESDLLRTSCSSSTECTAVGYYTTAGGTLVTLAERWNGTEWKVQTTPNPKEAKESSLEAVSCPSSTDCTATGSYRNASGTLEMLAEQWNGTEWKVQVTPSPEGAVGNRLLQGVSCSSATACTAVGQYETLARAVTLAERWNGTEWKVQTTPIVGEKGEEALLGVSCFSGTECTTVGYGFPTGEEALADRWNGTEWKAQTTPEVKGSHFEDVSCSSATACTGAGRSGELPLAERWNGTEWKVQTTPKPEGAKNISLAALSCPSTTSCTAAGTYKNSAEKWVTLAESWNVFGWAVQSTPNPEGAKETHLVGVSCSSSVACIATGYYRNSAGTVVTLAESYH